MRRAATAFSWQGTWFSLHPKRKGMPWTCAYLKCSGKLGRMMFASSVCRTQIMWVMPAAFRESSCNKINTITTNIHHPPGEYSLPSSLMKATLSSSSSVDMVDARMLPTVSSTVNSPDSLPASSMKVIYHPHSQLIWSMHECCPVSSTVNSTVDQIIIFSITT